MSNETAAAMWAQLDVFEALLKQHEGRFVVNDEVTIADLQLFFEFQNLIYLNLEWSTEKYPNIDRWYQDMLGVPSVKGINEQWKPVAEFLKAKLNP